MAVVEPLGLEVEAGAPEGAHRGTLVDMPPGVDRDAVTERISPQG